MPTCFCSSWSSTIHFLGAQRCYTVVGDTLRPLCYLRTCRLLHLISRNPSCLLGHDSLLVCFTLCCFFTAGFRRSIAIMSEWSPRHIWAVDTWTAAEWLMLPLLPELATCGVAPMRQTIASTYWHISVLQSCIWRGQHNERGGVKPCRAGQGSMMCLDPAPRNAANK